MSAWAATEPPLTCSGVPFVAATLRTVRPGLARAAPTPQGDQVASTPLTHLPTYRMARPGLVHVAPGILPPTTLVHSASLPCCAESPGMPSWHPVRRMRRTPLRQKKAAPFPGPLTFFVVFRSFILESAQNFTPRRA